MDDFSAYFVRLEQHLDRVKYMNDSIVGLLDNPASRPTGEMLETLIHGYSLLTGDLNAAGAQLFGDMHNAWRHSLKPSILDMAGATERRAV
jgi:hypothetical protein